MDQVSDNPSPREALRERQRLSRAEIKPIQDLIQQAIERVGTDIASMVFISRTYAEVKVMVDDLVQSKRIMGHDAEGITNMTGILGELADGLQSDIERYSRILRDTSDARKAVTSQPVLRVPANRNVGDQQAFWVIEGVEQPGLPSLGERLAGWRGRAAVNDAGAGAPAPGM